VFPAASRAADCRIVSPTVGVAPLAGSVAAGCVAAGRVAACGVAAGRVADCGVEDGFAAACGVVAGCVPAAGTVADCPARSEAALGPVAVARWRPSSGSGAGLVGVSRSPVSLEFEAAGPGAGPAGGRRVDRSWRSGPWSKAWRGAGLVPGLGRRRSSAADRRRASSSLTWRASAPVTTCVPRYTNEPRLGRSASPFRK
jgi:hypothetical protein